MKAPETNPAKRFLVTYTDGTISRQEASDILSVDSAAVQNAETLMATDAILTANDVVYFDHMGISSLVLTDEQAQALQNHPGVLAVEEDREMFALEAMLIEDYDKAVATAYQSGYTSAMFEVFQKLVAPPATGNGQAVGSALPGSSPLATQPIPWNINQVKAPGAWAKGYRGAGVKVAVLDTGVAAHADLVIAGGVSFVPGVASYNDGHGHGTHCCGVVGARNNAVGVVGVAPECALYAVKVLSDAGSGATSSIIAGMTWAKNNGMKVVSMSLGALSGPSVAYATAISQLNAAGVTVVCAAGNSYQSAFPWVNSPANSAGAVAVGAIDSASAIASFSSRGAQPGSTGWNPVTVVGPGVNVYSTYKGNTYTTMSGTSMATPHVAGAAVLIKQRYPAYTPAQVKTLLQKTATDLGPAGRDLTYGAGLINCEKAVS